MQKNWFMIIIVLVIGYVIGSMYPGWFNQLRAAVAPAG